MHSPASLRPLPLAVVVLTFGLALWLASLQGAYPSDDALIHLRYAHNLAEHGELAFNPGEKSFSTTSPLWNVVVGLVARAAGTGKDAMLRLSQIVAVALLALAAAALTWLAREIHGRWLPLVAVLLVLDPYVTATVHGAMEQPLFLALGAAGLALVVRGERGSRPALIAAAVVFAAQYAARPEALAFVAAAGICLLLRRRWRSLLVFAIAVVVALIPVLLALERSLGSVVPLSMLMKTHDARGWLPFSAIGSARQVVRLWLQVYALPTLLVGGLLAFAVDRPRRPLLERNLLPLLVVVLLGLAYVGFLKERIVSSRYLVNFMPFAYVAAASILAAVKPPRLALLAGGGLAVYLVALNLLAAPRRVDRGLRLEPERIEIGTWLRENTPADAAVWVFDIGYIGYHAERRIYDFNLVDAPTYSTGTALKKRRGELDLAAAVSGAGIDYLVWGPRNPPDLPLERVYTVQHATAAGHRVIYRVLPGD